MQRHLSFEMSNLVKGPLQYYDLINMFNSFDSCCSRTQPIEQSHHTYFLCTFVVLLLGPMAKAHA